MLHINDNHYRCISDKSLVSNITDKNISINQLRIVISDNH